jgi:putative transposase
VSRSSCYYISKKQDMDGLIKTTLLKIAEEHHRWGFKKMFDKLSNDGWSWNHKRVHRIYCELGLNIRIRPKKRIPRREAKSIAHPIAANVCWSMDFMSDVLASGRTFRTLNVIDDYNRECLLIKPSLSLPATVVIRALEELASTRGYPDMIRVDNGPEFISKQFRTWAEEHQIFIQYIQPGKPSQNGLIERFNRTYREDILDAHIFHDLDEVNQITTNWQRQYNYERPHEAIKSLSPMAFAKYREDIINQLNV